MNRTAKLTVIVLIVLSVAGGIARPTQAEPRGKPSAEASYRKGMKAYTLGHFPEAIEEFEKAYDLRAEPIFLYNIAQSHRQNNSPQRALFFYRRYLEAQPDAKNRAEIEQRIKDLQSQLNAQAENVPAPPPPAPQPVVQPVAAPSPSVAEPEQVAQVQAQPEPAQSTGRGLRIAGVTIGIVGVASAVTGVVLGLHANSLYQQATTPGSPYDPSKDQSSKTFRTLEWVSLGVGGAAIVAGSVLYYLGASAKSASASVAVMPLIAPGAGGAAIFGRF
jgi:tetratricopeptide (TPR) repeat protein